MKFRPGCVGFPAAGGNPTPAPQRGPGSTSGTRTRIGTGLSTLLASPAPRSWTAAPNSAPSTGVTTTYAVRPEGRQVPVADTVRGFKEILEGKHDKVPEGNFYMKGGIDEVKPD